MIPKNEGCWKYKQQWCSTMQVIHQVQTTFIGLNWSVFFWRLETSMSIYIYNIYTYVYTVYIAYNLSTFSVKKYLMICRSTIHKHMKLKFIPNDIVFMISFVGSQWTPEKGWIEDELKNSSSTILNEWDSTNQTCCYGSTSSPTNTLLKLTWIHQLAMFEKQYLFQTLIFKIWAASGFSPEQKAA